MTAMRAGTRGFSLIEMLFVLLIISVLGGISIPAYHIYLNNSALSLAESSLATALRRYGALEGYHPASGHLGDLVAKGLLREIPNDPWTKKTASATGVGDVGDWYYANNGRELTFYPLSGRGKAFTMSSLGLPPTASPAAAATAAGKGAVAPKPLSRKAARLLARASRWNALANALQKRANTLASGISRWSATRDRILRYAARYPSWKRYAAAWKRFVARKQRELKKVRRRIARYRGKAISATRKAAIS